MSAPAELHESSEKIRLVDAESDRDDDDDSDTESVARGVTTPLPESDSGEDESDEPSGDSNEELPVYGEIVLTKHHVKSVTQASGEWTENESIEEGHINQYVYRIDTEKDEKMLDILQKEMNGNLKLSDLYSPQALDLLRYHAPTPIQTLPRIKQEDIKDRLYKFELPTLHAANSEDIYKLAKSLDGDLIAPLDPNGIAIARGADVSVHQSQRFHSIPLEISIMEGVNTTCVDMGVMLETPNTDYETAGSLYKQYNHTEGVIRSGGDDARQAMDRLTNLNYDAQHDNAPYSTFGATLPAATQTPAKPTFDDIYSLDADESLFSSPEARRWALVDTEKVISSMKNQNQGALGVGKLGSKKKGTLREFKVVTVALRPRPKKFVEFLAVSYSHAIIRQCSKDNYPRPETSVIDGQLNVTIPIEVIEHVIHHYHRLYNPSKYAFNQFKWQVRFQPRDLLSLKIAGVRNPGVPARVEVVLRVREAKFPTGTKVKAPHLSAGIAAELTSDHFRVMELAQGITDYYKQQINLKDRERGGGQLSVGKSVPVYARTESEFKKHLDGASSSSQKQNVNFDPRAWFDLRAGAAAAAGGSNGSQARPPSANTDRRRVSGWDMPKRRQFPPASDSASASAATARPKW